MKLKSDENSVEEIAEISDDEDKPQKAADKPLSKLISQVRTDGNYTGLNFAPLQPLGENAEIIFAGQTGTNAAAPQRFETDFKFRPQENHQIQSKRNSRQIRKD